GGRAWGRSEYADGGQSVFLRVFQRLLRNSSAVPAPRWGVDRSGCLCSVERANPLRAAILGRVVPDGHPARLQGDGVEHLRQYGSCSCSWSAAMSTDYSVAISDTADLLMSALTP